MTKWEKGWTRVEKFIVGLLAFSATLIAFYGVIARYIFRRPPDWAEEIVIYLIIWAVFITASTLAAEKGHVAATLMVERFSLKTRRNLAVFNGLVALVSAWRSASWASKSFPPPHHSCRRRKRS